MGRSSKRLGLGSRVEAVALDQDGVLIDTETINVRAAFEAFAEFGCVLEPDDAAAIVGRHPVDYAPAFATRFGLSDGDVDALRHLQNEIYVARWLQTASLKSGVLETLAALRARELPLALATSSGRSHVEHCLDRFGLRTFFAVTMTKDDVTRRKPDPEIYLLCAARLRVPPDRLLVVEDSEHGVRSAKAAGCPCVAVRTPHTPAARLGEADALVDELPEILGWV